MLTWLRSRTRPGRTATALYGSIVAQARNRAFYAECGVPDTMEGRFGVIGVHMFLVLERIRAAGQSGDDIARALLETFMTDMDDNLREIGIGDTGVPRRVKKAAVALHEHLAGYRASMAMPADTALITALAENVYLGSGTGQPAVIARYMRRASETIGHSSWNEVCAGRFVFPAVQS